jgi:hypothetical protein
MRWVIPFLFCLTAQAGMVPFYSNAAYTRDEQMPCWWVTNNLSPSRLFLNGVYQSQETGTNDLQLNQAWAISNQGVKVGVVDQSGHGDRVEGCVRQASPNSDVFRFEIFRWDEQDFADGVAVCAAQGCKVVTITSGFPARSVLDDAIAAHPNVLVFGAMLNQEGDLDGALVDYPYRAGHPNFIGVTSTDRNGRHYSPSATGTNCLAAPGRNIVAAGTYSSGTSWAAPIAAGCAALVWGKFPGATALQIAALIRSTAADVARRIDPLAAMRVAAPRLTISGNEVTVHGTYGQMYMLERSSDLKTWSDYLIVVSGQALPVPPGFYRARRL